MEFIDRRRHPRRKVSLSVIVSRPTLGRPAQVVDLSEGGARLIWTAPADIAVGAMVQLSVRLSGEQTLDLDARVVRSDETHLGLEFDADQRNLVQLVLAEAQSSD